MSDENNYGFSLYPNQASQDFYTPITPEPAQPLYSPVLEQPVVETYQAPLLYSAPPFVEQEEPVQLPYGLAASNADSLGTAAAPVFSNPFEQELYATNNAATYGAALSLGNKADLNNAVKVGHDAYYKRIDQLISEIPPGVKLENGEGIDMLVKGMEAGQEALSRKNIDPNDIWGQNVYKVDKYLPDTIQDGVGFHPSEEAILKDIATGRISENSTRIIKNSHASDLRVAELSNKNTVFAAPLERTVGFFGNGKQYAEAAGFPSKDIAKSAAKPHSVLIYSTPEDSEFGTLDNILKRADRDKEFKIFRDNNPNLSADLKSFDYASHVNKFEDGQIPAEYIKTLDPHTGNTLKAREYLADFHGANELLSGEGYTKNGVDGSKGMPEYISAKRKLTEVGPIVVRPLDLNKSGPMEVQDNPPKMQNKLISKLDVKNTAKSAGLTTLVLETGKSAINYFKGDEKAFEGLGERVGVGAAVGTASGVASIGIERTFTKAVDYLERKWPDVAKKTGDAFVGFADTAGLTISKYAAVGEKALLNVVSAAEKGAFKQFAPIVLRNAVAATSSTVSTAVNIGTSTANSLGKGLTTSTPFGAQALRQVGGSILSGGVIGGGISALTQGYKLWTQDESTPVEQRISKTQAAGTVASEIVVGGIGAGITTAVVGGIFGTAATLSFPVVVTGLVVGVGADYALRGLGVDKGVKGATEAIIKWGDSELDAMADGLRWGVGGAIAGVDKGLDIAAAGVNYGIDGALAGAGYVADGAVSAAKNTAQFGKDVWNWATDW